MDLTRICLFDCMFLSWWFLRVFRTRAYGKRSPWLSQIRFLLILNVLRAKTLKKASLSQHWSRVRIWPIQTLCKPISVPRSWSSSRKVLMYVKEFLLLLWWSFFDFPSFFLIIKNPSILKYNSITRLVFVNMTLQINENYAILIFMNTIQLSFINEIQRLRRLVTSILSIQ